jgi:hypothetical protein
MQHPITLSRQAFICDHGQALFVFRGWRREKGLQGDCLVRARLFRGQLGHPLGVDHPLLVLRFEGGHVGFAQSWEGLLEGGCFHENSKQGVRTVRRFWQRNGRGGQEQRHQPTGTDFLPGIRPQPAVFDSNEQGGSVPACQLGEPVQ